MKIYTENLVEITETGVVCGKCTKERGEKIRHASSTEVRNCSFLPVPATEYCDSYDAEILAERIIEERGYWEN